MSRLDMGLTLDITKCASSGCPQADTCWRKLAPTAIMQSYAYFREDISWGKINTEEGSSRCGAYWPVEKKNKRGGRENGI